MSFVLSPTKSGEDRGRLGSDKNGTSFVVPHSKTLRVTMPSQQSHRALPQAKPLDFIGGSDLGKTVRWGDVARSALECGARHEAPLCRSKRIPKALRLGDCLSSCAGHQLLESCNKIHLTPFNRWRWLYYKLATAATRDFWLQRPQRTGNWFLPTLGQRTCFTAELYPEPAGFELLRRSGNLTRSFQSANVGQA